MAIKISKTSITVNGKRAGVRYDAGPWISGINPGLIKIRPRQYSFPAEFKTAFTVENNSDITTDYFEKDSIRVLPDHPLYEKVKAVAIA